MRAVFSSEALAAAEYDAVRGILRVEFRDQSIYAYTGVPAPLYKDLLNASSKGAYFNRAIRGRFPHARVASSSRGAFLS
jgi:hypothetical protein